VLNERALEKLKTVHFDGMLAAWTGRQTNPISARSPLTSASGYSSSRVDRPRKQAHQSLADGAVWVRNVSRRRPDFFLRSS